MISELIPYDLPYNSFTFVAEVARRGVQGEVYQATLDSSRVAVKISRQNTDYAKRTFERERRVVDLLKEAKAGEM